MPSKPSKLATSTITSKSFKPINKEVIDEAFDPSEQIQPSFEYVLLWIIFALAISFFILNWLTKVNKCKCANIKESRYLKEWFTFLIIYQIIMAINFIITGTTPYNNQAIMVVSIIMVIINLAMTIRLVIYIHKLKQIKCDCGMTVQENIIYYWFIIGFSIVLFTILLIILGLLISYMNR